MVEESMTPTGESVESKSNRRHRIDRRTFAKGTGAGLALASMGAFGGNVAAQTDDDGDDTDGVEDGSDEMNGLGTQFRQMEREMYVAALAGENGEGDGAGVAVFLPEAGMQDPTTSGDDTGDEVGDDAEDDDSTDDSDDIGDGAGTDAQNDGLQYQIFLMNVDDPAGISLNEGGEGDDGEVVETLVDFTEEMDGVGDDGDGTDVDGGDTDDEDDGGEDGDAIEQGGLSGTIEEPIVVTGVIGGDSADGIGADAGEDDEDTDDEDGADAESGLDVQDFKQNPWEYHISVEGNGTDVGEDEADDSDIADDENGTDDNGLGGNGTENGDILLRGQVTTGLLAGEDNLEDRVEDDEDETDGEDSEDQTEDDPADDADDSEDDTDDPVGADEPADNETDDPVGADDPTDNETDGSVGSDDTTDNESDDGGILDGIID